GLSSELEADTARTARDEHMLIPQSHGGHRKEKWAQGEALGEAANHCLARGDADRPVRSVGKS
ncbi:MAG: hypothetical protein NTZ29_06480, partial [Verrucomicrobia bacterium]|nr:hypothetical protein [Verrucomicrobiota bacterium]